MSSENLNATDFKPTSPNPQYREIYHVFQRLDELRQLMLSLTQKNRKTNYISLL